MRVRPFQLLLFLALLFASTYALADGEARVKIPPGSKIFVEPFSGDQYSLQGRVETELLKYGYTLVTSPDKAEFHAIWSYVHGATTYASFRVANANDEVVYFDESKNPGFGTLLNKVGSTWGCIRRSMDGLKP